MESNIEKFFCKTHIRSKFLTGSMYLTGLKFFKGLKFLIGSKFTSIDIVRNLFKALNVNIVVEDFMKQAFMSYIIYFCKVRVVTDTRLPVGQQLFQIGGIESFFGQLALPIICVCVCVCARVCVCVLPFLEISP